MAAGTRPRLRHLADAHLFDSGRVSDGGGITVYHDASEQRRLVAGRRQGERSSPWVGPDLISDVHSTHRTASSILGVNPLRRAALFCPAILPSQLTQVGCRQLEALGQGVRVQVGAVQSRLTAQTW